MKIGVALLLEYYILTQCELWLKFEKHYSFYQVEANYFINLPEYVELSVDVQLCEILKMWYWLFQMPAVFYLYPKSLAEGGSCIWN